MPPADFLCFTSLFAWLRLTRFDVCAPSSQVDSQREWGVRGVAPLAAAGKAFALYCGQPPAKRCVG